MSSTRSGAGSKGTTGAKSGGGTSPVSVKTTKSDQPTKAPAPESMGSGGGGGAATARRRLGRGLSSLLNEAIAIGVPAPAALGLAKPSAPEAPAPEVAETGAPPAVGESVRTVDGSAAGDEASGPRVVALRVGTIAPSPFQPRRVFDQGALERLAASIRTAGVMQPILVRRAPMEAGGIEFELVAGERRWRAAQLAGLDAVPAIVAVLADEQAAEWALIENVQREELGAMERAWALRSLVERFGLTHAEAADKVGLDRSSVSNLIRLTDLEEPIRMLLEEGRLGVGHGKALLAAPAGPARVALARRAAEGSWSVRRLEHAAPAAAQALAPAAPAGGDEDKRVAERARALGREELERQLGEHLGTNVSVRTGRGGARGRLVVEFYDLDHFDGLMARMGFQIK